MRRIRPNPGDKRIVRRFCFLPIWIDNVTVWLERVYLVQVYRKYWGFGFTHETWETLASFTNEKIEEAKEELCR
jgi:hypothetical protein